MTKEQMWQLERFFTAHLGDGWKSGPFAHLNAEQTVEALWPMNEVFRKHHAQIASLVYSPVFEAEADQALAHLADGGNWTVNSPSAGAWRVLYERHSQSLMLAAIKHAEGNAQMVPIPRALPSSHHKLAVMLFLQWAMVLPFPIENKSAFAWPEGAQPGSLLRH